MRRALLVGIDDYPRFPLQGCVNDAKRLANVLERHHDGKLNFQCEIVTAPPQSITRASLRKKINDLLGQPADVAFFHFSGHGTWGGRAEATRSMNRY